MPLRTSDQASRASQLFCSKLARDLEFFSCPRCQVSVQYCHFEKHCETQHDVKPKLQCSWCFGAYTWRSRQKYKHLNHIIECYERFKVLHSPPPVLSDTDDPAEPPPLPASFQPRLLNLRHRYLKQHLYQRFPHKPLRPYHFPRPLPLSPNPLPFQDQTLNLASSCMQKYRRMQENDFGSEWFHVSVRIPAYKKFLQMIGSADSYCHTLPFSCWCDGGKETEAKYRQHRHMIVVCTLASHFKKRVWNRVKPDKPRPNYRVRFCKPIKDAEHLLHTMAYVSHRRSGCTFDDPDGGPLKDNHFWLAETLPIGYKLPLYLQYENGLVDYINQRCKNLKMRTLVESPHLVRHGLQHRLKIKHIPVGRDGRGRLELATVLPVAKTFQPCSHATASRLHLMDGQVLSFEQNLQLEALDPEAWLQRQAELGNVFLQVVSERFWTPRPFYQGLINEFRPLMNEKRDLLADWERERAGWARERAALEDKCQAMEQACRDKCHAMELAWQRERAELEQACRDKCQAVEQEWRGKYEAAELEVKALLQKINQLHEGEIARLQTENEQLKREMAELRRENAQFRLEMEQLRRENEELKRENAELKRENAELKRENAELKKENAELKRDNAELKRENAELKKENAQLRSEMVGLQNEIAQFRIEMARLQSEIVRLGSEVAQLLKENAQLRGGGNDDNDDNY